MPWAAISPPRRASSRSWRRPRAGGGGRGRGGAARGRAAGARGDSPRRWARWAGRWSAHELERALRLALDADRALKSSTLTDEAGTIAQLVLSFGALQGAAA